MQHPRSIHTDEIEKGGTDEVEDDRDGSYSPINAHPLVIIEVAYGLDTSVARLEDGDVNNGTVRPNKKIRTAFLKKWYPVSTPMSVCAATAVNPDGSHAWCPMKLAFQQ